MIIMLNGSFGVGKTSTAKALLHKMPQAMLFDPEEVGVMLRAITAGARLPHEETGDFQDLDLWPTMTVLTAERVYRHYRRPLIVPMTIIQPAYLHQIRAGLAAIAPPLFHFWLTASLPTIRRRLLARGEREHGWPWRQAELCVAAVHGADFEEHLNAEQPTEAIVQHVLQRVASDC